MNKQKLLKLAKIADKLDMLGLRVLANEIDQFIKSASSPLEDTIAYVQSLLPGKKFEDLSAEELPWITGLANKVGLSAEDLLDKANSSHIDLDVGNLFSAEELGDLDLGDLDL